MVILNFLQVDSIIFCDCRLIQLVLWLFGATFLLFMLCLSLFCLGLLNFGQFTVTYRQIILPFFNLLLDILTKIVHNICTLLICNCGRVLRLRIFLLHWRIFVFLLTRRIYRFNYLCGVVFLEKWRQIFAILRGYSSSLLCKRGISILSSLLFPLFLRFGNDFSLFCFVVLDLFSR